MPHMHIMQGRDNGHSTFGYSLGISISSFFEILDQVVTLSIVDQLTSYCYFVERRKDNRLKDFRCR